MPAVLMKDCFDVLLPVITQIVDLSVDNAIVPTKFKEAALNPIIKKESLDHELFSSLRPPILVLYPRQREKSWLLF